MGIMHEGWAIITPRGEFQRFGVDHFNSVVIKRTHNLMVVKQDGGTYWSGIGQRGRAGAEYQVWEITEVGEDEREGFERLHVRLLIDFPVRKIKEVV